MGCGVEQPTGAATRPADAQDEAHEGSARMGASESGEIALIDRARGALVDGELPGPIKAEVLASNTPDLAAARRIFGPEDSPGTATPPATATSNDPKKKPVPLRLPDGAPARGASEHSDRAAVAPGPTPTATASTPTAPAKPSVAGKDARLVMLTSLGLQQRGGAIVLDVKSSGRPTVSIASQGTRGRVTFMFANAGALPLVRQARPALDGVRVVEVRRGETTVPVTVDLQEGWRSRRPAPTDGGVQVRFQRDAGDAP